MSKQITQPTLDEADDAAWFRMNQAIIRFGSDLGKDVRAVWSALASQHNAGQPTTIGADPIRTCVRKVNGENRLFVHQDSIRLVERQALTLKRERLDNDIMSFVDGPRNAGASAPNFR